MVEDAVELLPSVVWSGGSHLFKHSTFTDYFTGPAERAWYVTVSPFPASTDTGRSGWVLGWTSHLSQSAGSEEGAFTWNCVDNPSLKLNPMHLNEAVCSEVGFPSLSADSPSRWAWCDSALSLGPSRFLSSGPPPSVPPCFEPLLSDNPHTVSPRKCWYTQDTQGLKVGEHQTASIASRNPAEIWNCPDAS